MALLVQSSGPGGRVRAAWLRALALLLVLGLALPAAARVVRLYEVRHRLASELVPMAETALGAGGRVSADARTNVLLLTGESAAVEDALALLARLDVKLRTVRLRYASHDSASLARLGVRVRWRVDAGALRVGSLWGPGPGDGTRAIVSLDGALLQQEGRHASSLRILEGESGRIAAGVVAPLPARRVLHGRDRVVVQESTQWVPAESGFEARPRVLGDGRIELTLRPFHDRLGADGRIETAGAETRLVLSQGETLVIGGLSDAGRSGRREGLAAAGSAEQSDRRVLLVRVDLE